MIRRDTWLERGKHKNFFARTNFENAAASITDVKIAVAIDRNLLRSCELAELLADAAEALQVAAFGIEHHHAEVAAVDDVQPPFFANREIARQVELTRARTAPADVH